MHLRPKEKECITQIWAKAACHIDELGAEVMHRLFVCYPATKTYFSNFNLEAGSADLKTQGGKILHAVGEATHHIDDLDSVLSKLSDLHAFKLRVDPGNFKHLCHCILVVLAIHYPEDFTAAAHCAWDKFLLSVSNTLCSKYR